MSMKGKLRNIFGFDEDEYEVIEEEVTEPVAEEGKSKRKNVVSLQAVQKSSKMILCEPRSYEEVQDIADHIMNRRSVVVNLQRVDVQEARKIIDFLGGAVYALSGEMKKVGSQTFLCAPDHVEVTGNITEVMEDIDLDQRW
ncbi:cell division inhibitor SepF [Gracilibacillus halotolerans]|uniref:Cell division protein SepF n=2 Tax=Gracilibacillus halotolerans TaxID=74386 RepID=A0A841RFX7_9BACI|nr:cell division inhibitor SepF [Gracilibacillus halotolerans]